MRDEVADNLPELMSGEDPDRNFSSMGDGRAANSASYASNHFQHRNLECCQKAQQVFPVTGIVFGG